MWELTSAVRIQLVWYTSQPDGDEQAPSQTHTESHFAGSFDKAGKPCIASVSVTCKPSVYPHLFPLLCPVLKATTIWQAIHQTFTTRLSKGTRQVTGYTFPFLACGHGVIRVVGRPDSVTLALSWRDVHEREELDGVVCRVDVKSCARYKT
ncbi:hypothetical protein F5J12DRAFT_346348 [Pisolithus orientalis]|uniref:uncharacterized protein n=1 Tax=Pisolithus orientalis TaxID=936130 RepID=UPI002225259F|nr:uncharacterized protein F5J12DRAFT_346348 [Pisolithus orientalis]KAI5996846.1 hypothetical protein F5J12DRAFT_346348 [Pisolithus orientalis]